MMYNRALAGKEKAWGPEHTSTLDTVNNLGILYADQGRHKDAEMMYNRALAGFEKAWGPEHTSTLNTVNNLGLLYKSRPSQRCGDDVQPCAGRLKRRHGDLSTRPHSTPSTTWASSTKVKAVTRMRR
jgi:hypothetical protein